MPDPTPSWQRLSPADARSWLAEARAAQGWEVVNDDFAVEIDDGRALTWMRRSDGLVAVVTATAGAVTADAASQAAATPGIASAPSAELVRPRLNVAVSPIDSPDAPAAVEQAAAISAPALDPPLHLPVDVTWYALHRLAARPISAQDEQGRSAGHPTSAPRWVRLREVRCRSRQRRSPYGQCRGVCESSRTGTNVAGCVHPKVRRARVHRRGRRSHQTSSL